MNFENEETVAIFDVESNDMCFQAPQISSKLGVKEVINDGQYNAKDDNLDGYSSINVNVLGDANLIAKTSGSGTETYIDVKMLGDVPEYLFKNVKSVHEIDLTLSHNISNNAFENASTLTKVIAPNPLKIGEYAFSGCKNVVGEITIDKEQTIIEDYTFRNCESLEINLHDNITKIGSYAFYRAETLKLKKLSNKLIELGTYSFQQTGIAIKEIPEGIQKIPTYCFFQCKSIETLKIGDNVSIIDTYAFRYCTSLTSVEIGTGITKLNNYSFGNCTNLESITMHALKPPTISSLNTFYNDSNLKEIRVPLSVLETYKSYTGWSNYADIMVGIEGE